ncbi:MAG: hypothetical protein FJZ16_02550 [Candidatus Omnitrophica bacterium]|nr:hypothetical protein [Candidatus Omnitrophota bacterium]
MRLFTVLCIAALALAVALPVYAEVQNVKVGGDILIRGVHRDDYDFRNDSKDNNAATQDRSSLYNTVTRVNVNADLTDNVSTAVRLINERDWDVEGQANTDIDLDIASVTLKELIYSPLTLTLGRQEIKFGNGLVIADRNRPNYSPSVRGTVDLATNTAAGRVGWTGPNGTLTAGYGDLTLRKAFDAIRATLDYDKWTIDGVIIKINETGLNTNDDDLCGVNVGYKFDKYNAGLEGYLVYDRDESFNRTMLSNSGEDILRTYEKSELYVIGLRGTIDPIENLNLNGEVAYQAGEIRDDTIGATEWIATSQTKARDRQAWAADVAGSYSWANVTYKPKLGLSYTYRSGEEAGNDGDYELWEPLFTDQVRGEIAKVALNGPNAGNTSNASIIGVNLSVKPIEKLLASLDYYHSWLAEKLSETEPQYGATTNRKGKKDLADEVDLNLTYNYTEDVSFGLLGAVLWPGDSFAGGFDETAFETVGSVKVTF